MIVFDLDSRRINRWLSAFALLCRVLALTYALVLTRFHPHPVIEAREGIILAVWWGMAAYTAGLIVLFFVRDAVLRAPVFLVFDTLLCGAILIPTDGGYRNVFALHSAIPVLTTAFSIPASPTLWRRGLLLLFVGGVSTFGFALSLWLNGYSFASVIEQRAVDEVILRTGTYPILALVLGFIALLMVLWQRSLERMNALQADAAIEAERRRIAMDIHDSVLSRLTALSRRVEFAELLAAEAPEATRDELKRVAAMASDIHADIRWTVRALRDDPAQIRLFAVVRSIVERFERNTNLPVDVRLPAVEPTLSFDTLRHLGYIVEEALVNVWKHASCDAAWVAIETQDDQLHVVIGDNGVGFDPAAVAAWPVDSRGWGLENIHERAQQVGGQCHIEAAPGQGTRVSIQIPLHTQPGDARQNRVAWEDVWRLFGF